MLAYPIIEVFKSFDSILPHYHLIIYLFIVFSACDSNNSNPHIIAYKDPQQVEEVEDSEYLRKDDLA